MVWDDCKEIWSNLNVLWADEKFSPEKNIGKCHINRFLIPFFVFWLSQANCSQHTSNSKPDSAVSHVLSSTDPGNQILNGWVRDGQRLLTYDRIQKHGLWESIGLEGWVLRGRQLSLSPVSFLELEHTTLEHDSINTDMDMDQGIQVKYLFTILSLLYLRTSLQRTLLPQTNIQWQTTLDSQNYYSYASVQTSTSLAQDRETFRRFWPMSGRRVRGGGFIYMEMSVRIA